VNTGCMPWCFLKKLTGIRSKGRVSPRYVFCFLT
jgi:hypothetical protein